LFKGHEELSGDYWSKLKRGARVRNIEFEISIYFAWKLFLKQERLCALTGWEIHLSPSATKTASLDRIDSSKDYTQNNVQWVHKDVNRAKQNFSQNRFVAICEAVNRRQLSD
jgi:hypothetical protein